MTNPMSNGPGTDPVVVLDETAEVEFDEPLVVAGASATVVDPITRVVDELVADDLLAPSPPQDPTNNKTAANAGETLRITPQR